MYLTFASLLAELGVIPPARTISEVSLINRHPETQFPSEVSEVQIQFQPPAGSHYKEGCSISIGAATPPVPPKLVERIKTGDFIDMAELLPDRMGTSKSSMVDESTKSKVRRRPVSSIIEWVQCFNTYLSVMCRICPEKIPDLLAYQMLIVEASMVYEGNAWLGYDRRFRQAAAANPHMQWSKTDTDLWHLAFTGMIQRPRCVHCLSLTHKSPQCNWAQDTPEMPSSPKSGNWYYSQVDPKYQGSGICRSWNRDPRPGYSFPNCKFQHICTSCARNPACTDKSHKAVFCPYTRPRRLGSNVGSIPTS